MSVLHRRPRPAKPGPDAALAQADALLDREGRRERVRTALGLVVDAVGSGSAGMTAGLLLGVAGFAQVQPVAIAIAGAVATVAVRIGRAWAERSRAAILDLPGGRELAAKVFDELDRGPVATRKGSAWVVFDGVDAPPRVMSERAYLRYARTVPSIVEVDATDGMLFVTRHTYGEPDSVQTGLPAIEAYDHAGTRHATQWWIRGDKSDHDGVMRARALAEPGPSYAEEAFAPRI